MTARAIRWLHLSDLHFNSTLKHVWPTVRADFERDVSDQIAKTGPIDLVIFSGDLVNSGKIEEYDALTPVLASLLSFVERAGGRSPQLFTVPGNHDLSRPSPVTPEARVLANLRSMHEVRDELWNQDDTPYHRLLRDAFANYTRWKRTADLPFIPTTPSNSAIPADASATFEVDGIRVGLLGLNTAFLQLGSGEHQGKLALDISQASNACAGDIDDWQRAHDLRLLITHHPENWLDSEALAHFLAEIAVPGRFHIHLHGHLHQATADVRSTGGARPRLVWQAPSLFGLESYDKNGAHQVRTHGYCIDQAEVYDDDLYVRRYPRTAMTMQAGHRKLVAAQDLDLTEEHVEFRLKRWDKRGPREQLGLSEPVSAQQPAQASTSTHIAPNILTGAPTTDVALARLRAVPRWEAKAEPCHSAIREAERIALIEQLSVSRGAWVVGAWGLAASEFIASAIAPSNNAGTEVFRISCEESANDLDALTSRIAQQLGISLQSLLSLIDPIKRPVFVFDNITIDDDQLRSCLVLEEVARSILEFSQNATVIFVASRAPSHTGFPLVQLSPLDAADVKRYIELHRHSRGDAVSAATAARLHELTDGYPVHLDRALSDLRTTSLEELAASRVHPAAESSDNSPAIGRAIAELEQTSDRTSDRALKLLKALSVLPAGEPLEALKRFYPTEPFFAAHAARLLDRELLYASPLDETVALRGTDIDNLADSPKLLTVPKPVRLHVLSLLGTRERRAITLRAADHYFGETWREGTPQLSLTGTVLGASSDTPRLRNARAVLLSLLADANLADHQRAALLRAGLALIAAMRERARYREILELGGALLAQGATSYNDNQCARLHYDAGTAARMLGERDEALSHFESTRQLLKDGDKSLLVQVQLGIAHVHESAKRIPEARAAAERVIALEEHGSSSHAAKALLIETDKALNAQARRSQLIELEADARRRGYTTTADNIALTLARLSKSIADKRRWFDVVVNSKDDGYNLVRASVDRAYDLIESGDMSAITVSDRDRLINIYGYLYTQRLEFLFDRCHVVLWKIMMSEKGREPLLLRLFRHSSLVWRLHGKTEKEREYIEALGAVNSLLGGRVGSERELRYLLARRAAMRELDE